MTVDVLVFQVETLLKEKVYAFLFAFSTDIKEHSLLVTIFKVRIRSMINKQLHYLITLLVVDENSCKVEGRLSCLCLETIDDNRIIVCQELFDFVHGAESPKAYQHLIAMIKSLTTSYVASFLFIYSDYKPYHNDSSLQNTSTINRTQSYSVKNIENTNNINISQWFLS